MPQRASALAASKGAWQNRRGKLALGYLSKAFHAVNDFVLDRLQRHLCRRSQRRFRRSADQTWCALLQSLGLHLLSARTIPGRACLPARRSRGIRMR